MNTLAVGPVSGPEVGPRRWDRAVGLDKAATGWTATHAVPQLCSRSQAVAGS